MLFNLLTHLFYYYFSTKNFQLIYVHDHSATTIHIDWNWFLSTNTTNVLHSFYFPFAAADWHWHLVHAQSHTITAHSLFRKCNNHFKYSVIFQFGFVGRACVQCAPGHAYTNQPEVIDLNRFINCSFSQFVRFQLSTKIQFTIFRFLSISSNCRSHINVTSKLKRNSGRKALFD